MRAPLLLFRFLTDRRGATAIVVGIAAPVLVGAAGLGAEATFWSYRQRALQHLADAAAFAGATEQRAGGDAGDVEATVGDSFLANGFRDDLGSFDVDAPPSGGPFAGETAVQVSVQEDWPRFFTALFFDGPVTLRASATAQLEAGGEACILALDPDASAALEIGGAADVVLRACTAMANSDASDALRLSGAGNLEAACADAVGGVVTAGASDLTLSDCDGPRSGMPALEDPYADVAEPTVSGPCITPNVFAGPPSSVYNITPGRYCGLDMRRTVNLAAGLYVIDGGELSISSTAVVNGSGVTFFLTNGARLRINGVAEVNLSAPTSGPYAGLLFFGDRSGSPLDHIMNGSADSSFTGALYFPNDDLEIRGSNSTASGCTQIIARTVDFRVAAGMGVDCEGTGVRPLTIVGGVRLVG